MGSWDNTWSENTSMHFLAKQPEEFLFYENQTAYLSRLWFKVTFGADNDQSDRQTPFPSSFHPV